MSFKLKVTKKNFLSYQWLENSISFLQNHKRKKKYIDIVTIGTGQKYDKDKFEKLVFFAFVQENMFTSINTTSGKFTVLLCKHCALV